MYNTFTLNTPSHALIGAALRKGYAKRWGVPLSAVLWGSVAPDIPLYLLSVGGGLYYTQLMGMETRAAAELMFDDLFFNSVWWKGLHNLLHAPLVVLAGMGLTWRAKGKRPSETGSSAQRLRHWLFWFFAACLVHTTIDILTHAMDGPLILFPLNWDLRFQSPISYWDPDYYGLQFTVFELTLDVVLLVYLLFPPARRWLSRRLESNQPHQN